MIFEHASGLLTLGHEVVIVTEEHIDPQRYEWHSSAADFRWIVLDQAREERCDVAIATWWESPFLLQYIDAVHYIYFVQSIESLFWKKADPTNHDTRTNDLGRQLCESTYSFALPVITEAQWIQDYLSEKYNSLSWLVRNGIRKDVYISDGEAVSPGKKGYLRVLIEGPVDVFFKNVPKTVVLCQKAGVDEIWLLSSSDIDAFPGVDRVFSRVPIHETPAIYRSCDVLVKLSYIEGMFGPPLEMFHCGGTAIVFDVTGHDEYIVHGENSYVVAKDDDEQVVQYLQKLKENPAQLQRLKDGAKKTAENWPDWSVATSSFAQALVEITQQAGASRQYLSSWTKKLKDDSDTRFIAKTAREFTRRESEPRGSTVEFDNFVQLYCWQEEEGLQPDNVHWFHYISGKPVTASFEVLLSGFPFWIRIDPSVRMGVLTIDSIEILNKRTGGKMFACSKPDEFRQLYVTGTLQNLQLNESNSFLSYGDDPQIVLPAINSGEVGDRLKVNISLLESSVVQFVRQHSSHECDKNMESCGAVEGFRQSIGRFARKANNLLSSRS